MKVITRLSTFNGEAAFGTWVHPVAVNHLLDRKRSAVERLELTFGAFADDLHTGLTPVAPNAGPQLDLLACEVKHGCTLAMLTCLDGELRVAYVLGEVFGVSSAEAAWICETTEPAYRKRVSRARAAVRSFVAAHCGLVAPARARCHRRKRVPAAIALGRVDPAIAASPLPGGRRRCCRRDGIALRRRGAAAEHARRGRARRGRRPHPVARDLSPLPPRRPAPPPE